MTIVTTTFNCMDQIQGYIDSVLALDRALFDWIVLDAASTDGTRQVLEHHAPLFTWFASQSDAGTYYGLNAALAQVRTDYYVVFGADDRPSTTLLQDVLPLLSNHPALVLGAVRLMPRGALKRPGRRGWYRWSWGRVISHHSVGTVIRTDLHHVFGLYDTAYRIAADGLFLTRVLASSESIVSTDSVFGDYSEHGLSAREEVRSVCESFLTQLQAGAGFSGQLALMTLRLVKMRLANRSQARDGRR